jgi:hypothetical protein
MNINNLLPAVALIFSTTTMAQKSQTELINSAAEKVEKK